MRPPLPPDLDKVGDDLVAGVARAVDARRQRRRRALAGLGAVAAAIALPVVVVPAVGPGHREPVLLTGATIEPAVPVGCDQPRGRRVALPACVAREPEPFGRPRRW